MFSNIFIIICVVSALYVNSQLIWILTSVFACCFALVLLEKLITSFSWFVVIKVFVCSLFYFMNRLLRFLSCHSHFSFDLHMSNTRSTFNFIFTHLISIEFSPNNFNNPIKSVRCTNQNNNKVAVKIFSSVQFYLCECCCQYKV